MPRTKAADATKPEVVNAAEAVYNAMGYALSAYIKRAKAVEKMYGTEVMTGVLYDFNVLHVLNAIMPLRVMLNEKHIKSEKKRRTEWDAKTVTKTEVDAAAASKDFTEALQLLRQGIYTAMDEIFDSLRHYKQEDEVEYANLTKTVQKKCIIDTIAFFKKLGKKADEALIDTLMAK